MIRRAERRTAGRYVFRKELMAGVSSAYPIDSIKSLRIRLILQLTGRPFLYFRQKPANPSDRQKRTSKNQENGIVNIGKKGLCFVAQEEFPIGLKLYLLFRDDAESASMRMVNARVVWTRSPRPHTYQTGIHIHPDRRWYRLIDHLKETQVVTRQNSARKSESQLPKKLSAEKIQRMLVSRLWEERYQGVTELTDCEAFPNNLELLNKMINDEDYRVRGAVVNVLSEHPSSQARALLFETMHGDKHWLVRETAVIAVGRYPQHLILNALLTALDDPEPYVRYAVVDILGKLKDTAALPHLNSLLNDTDKKICHLARVSIKKIEAEPSP